MFSEENMQIVCELCGWKMEEDRGKDRKERKERRVRKRRERGERERERERKSLEYRLVIKL